jgi:hypothetical protein
MKMKLVSLWAMILLVAAGCRKNDGDATLPPPPPPPPPANALLVVKITGGYITPAMVDSAFAVWTKAGEEKKVKMEKRNDSLLVNLSEFSEGNGTMAIRVYTTKKFAQHYNSQWFLSKDIELKRSTAVVFGGPDGFNDANWLPRALIKDGIGHEALVALRPEDAYFSIKEFGHPVVKLEVTREYWQTKGGLTMAGGGQWRCNTGCGAVTNTDFFNFLPAMIGNKQWDHIEWYIMFWTDANGGWSIQLNHTL